MTLMIRRGDTRRVFLVPPLVVLKWPRLKNWREGIKSNLLEREFGSCRDARLCPLVWSHRTGWLLIMRWARPLSDAEWKAFEPTCVDFSTEPDVSKLVGAAATASSEVRSLRSTTGRLRSGVRDQ